MSAVSASAHGGVGDLRPVGSLLGFRVGEETVVIYQLSGFKLGP